MSADPASGTDAVTAAYCGRCGEAATTGDHSRCESLLRLEPPRFCPACRRRMKVQVTPRGWAADCVEHGPLRG
ncbi:MAG: hypothetical protein R2731_16935 [Nocardioides sp.]